ncbi:MAG: histidine phosphatase family protein [archaeon]
MALKNPNEYEKGKTIVYLVRHGDREKSDDMNSGMTLPGPGLTALGKKQAKFAALQFVKIKDEIDSLYCSEMTRAKETAKEIGRKIGKKPKVVKGIAEIHGSFFRKEFHNSFFWRSIPRYLGAKKALNKILDKNKGKVIVIVMHGHLIHALLGHKYGLSLKQRHQLHTTNCHFYKLRFDRRKLVKVYCMNAGTI